MEYWNGMEWNKEDMESLWNGMEWNIDGMN